jgi:hypothetical protein
MACWQILIVDSYPPAALQALCRAATVCYCVDTHAPARAIVVIGSTTNPFIGKGARHGYRCS